MLDFRRFEVITFDCYGTLIDWETGILNALRPLRETAHLRASDREMLEAYALLESALESGGDHLRYRDVLRGVMRGLTQRFGAAADKVDLDALSQSLPQWPAFPDTVESLRRLKKHYQLAILSNTDDDLFAETARMLQVPFDFVITAEQVGTYKPSHRNFVHAHQIIGVPKEKWLHAAQSRFHDIAPARALGISNVWVNRRHDKDGDGATSMSAAQPDLAVPDLKTLADLVDAARR
ncbi:MAG TPA: haloacid dehalogenase type II [Candidatus Krumholzibacteria bacterium]|nr:haloacid dehalogenase type II [Candidatus Krumholzibacteria bacterium]